MSAGGVGAQVPNRPAFSPSMIHVSAISPRSGPAGTEISVQAAGLPANTRVYVALAALHSGYEVLQTVTTNGSGELVATLKVPEGHRGHWTHTELVVLLREETSELMATSDPFHITNEAGMVQRGGEIELAMPGCPVLRSWDGFTYALVGREVRALIASAGHELTVEGPIREGTCGLQYAIDVARIVPAPGMR
jgi:hypothetical protein